MRKCRCVVLTLLSFACQFHRNRKHYIFRAEIYAQHKSQGRKMNNLSNGKRLIVLYVVNWITLYVNDYSVTYVNSFGVEYIPKEI